MDSVDFGYIFAFTSVDIFSKNVVVRLYPSLTGSDGSDFLKCSMEQRYRYTELLQTDGGPEFKGDFRTNVLKYSDRFRVGIFYRPNSFVYRLLNFLFFIFCRSSLNFIYK